MAEPISLPEAKKHLRVDSSGDDALITDKIVAAREWVEDQTGLILTRRPVTERFPCFGRMQLRAWPIDADQPVSIAYRDTFGADQAVTTAVVRATSRPAAVYPAAADRWPVSCSAEGGVDVTFTAGFATAAAVPQKLKQAMLVMLTGFYEDREGGDLFAAAERSARSLCRASRGRVL